MSIRAGSITYNNFFITYGLSMMSTIRVSLEMLGKSLFKGPHPSAIYMTAYTSDQSPSAIRAEVITIGDEILFGQIIDTNTQWISQMLDSLGIRTVRKTSVGDDALEIVTALQMAEQKAGDRHPYRWTWPYKRRPDQAYPGSTLRQRPGHTSTGTGTHTLSFRAKRQTVARKQPVTGQPAH